MKYKVKFATLIEVDVDAESEKDADAKAEKMKCMEILERGQPVQVHVYSIIKA